MKFERFHLVDSRGDHNRILLKFYHVASGKPVSGGPVETLRILQMGEVQVLTRFATESIVLRFANHKHRNLKKLKAGDPINVYSIPVKLSEDGKSFVAQFG